MREELNRELHNLNKFSVDYKCCRHNVSKQGMVHAFSRYFVNTL